MKGPQSPMTSDLYVWEVVETSGFESAWVARAGLRLNGNGHAVGQLPEPYALDYVLETDAEAATRLHELTIATKDHREALSLRREGERWSVNGDARPNLDGALDCDLACLTLTNTMPIIRHGLHAGGEAGRDFLMAFVTLPALRVVPSKQSYRHLSKLRDGALVRYLSGSFSQDLIVDSDGFIVEYPTMARRIYAMT